MLEFLQNNWGSFAVGAVVLAVIVLIVMKLVREGRQIHLRRELRFLRSMQRSLRRLPGVLPRSSG